MTLKRCLTYLANSIEKADSGGPSPVIPYSLVTAVDSQPGSGTAVGVRWHDAARAWRPTRLP